MLITDPYIVRTNDVENVISSIKNLAWDKMDPHHLVWAFCEMGKEYSDSVRIVLKTYPNNDSVKKLAEEELDTNNLAFAGYSDKQDHYKFLEHFINKDKQKFDSISPALKHALIEGESLIRRMSDYDRSMTVFLREKRGQEIFKKILANHDFGKAGLDYFEYYIRRHIELDSETGGHGSLAEHFQISPNVAYNFYLSRLEIYKNCQKNL